jgi:hypothetical protein
MTDSESSDAPDAPKRVTLSQTTRAAIWNAHGRRCAYTGEQLGFADLEIDHIIPITASASEIARLVDEKVIPANFDLNGLGNLLPTTAFQNSRKRANLRNNSALHHFLGVAQQHRGAAEAYIKASATQDKSLQAYLQLKAQAEKNDLSVDDIIDINRQEADGLTRLRLIPELADAGGTTLLNATLAQELLRKPFALSGGSISTVTLQDNEGKQTVCTTCEEFLRAKDNKLWPRTQFDMNCFGLADRTCETLRALTRARYAPASLIRYPRITCRNLDRWSSEWVANVWIESAPDDDKLLQRCPDIASLSAEGGCVIINQSDWMFTVDPKRGLALKIAELFRADLDDDGAEEILIFHLIYAPDGTLRAGTVGIAKPMADGLIHPLPPRVSDGP